MTKAELIKEISTKTGIDRPRVETILETCINSIKDTVSQQEEVYLRGFGTFTLKRRAAKIARDIRKNIAIQLPAHYIPYFKSHPRNSARRWLEM